MQTNQATFQGRDLEVIAAARQNLLTACSVRKHLMIPQIVHYVWVGPKPLPADAKELIGEWKSLMPDWRFMLWSEENIDFRPLFIRQAHGVRSYNRVANYVRLAALRDHGGFYMDHDIKLLKSLHQLCHLPGVLGFQTDKDEYDLVNSALIGASPGHPFIRRALDELETMDGSYDWRSRTGPGLLSRLLRDSDAIQPRDEPYIASGMMLYPPRYFYPYAWDKKFTPECIEPDTIAIHLWEHTWKTQPGRVRRLMKSIRRALTRISPTLRSSWVKRRDTAAKNACRTNFGEIEQLARIKLAFEPARRG